MAEGERVTDTLAFLNVGVPRAGGREGKERRVRREVKEMSSFVAPSSTSFGRESVPELGPQVAVNVVLKMGSNEPNSLELPLEKVMTSPVSSNEMAMPDIVTLPRPGSASKSSLIGLVFDKTLQKPVFGTGVAGHPKAVFAWA
jgi:hypothetical protein